MGSGTWTLTGSGITVFDLSTTTGLTPTFSNAPLILSANSAARNFFGGNQTYNSFTVANNSTLGTINITATNTFASMTIGSGNNIQVQSGVTTTITGALNINGTAAAPGGLFSNNATAAATVSVGSASALTWSAVARITKAGAGSISATNSLDLGGNTGITVTTPGAAAARVIGG